ncbi:MAG: DNA sulfur modification protein DndB [Candidatus Aminicenantes bacterium]|jgi:DNA sulfur modification protein DndB
MRTAEYVFTALRGRQAGREYYVVMCPMKLVPKIFLFQEEEIPAELRAQRTLNRARIPDITLYMVENRSDYVFSSITASIDGEIKFEELTAGGKPVDNDEIGLLRVSMDARFVVNDGQHRRAAIEEALKEFPDLGEETISVVFFVDVGLKRSQQMFADLNKHAVRPTRSIGILYDRRDPLSKLACQLVNDVQVFRNLTEVEKSSISNRSTKLFTLSSIYQGTMALLKKPQNCKEVSEDEEKFAVVFWNTVCDNMPDWKLAARKEILTHELRRDYVHAHGLAMLAIGKLGAELRATQDRNLQEELKKLAELDWRRNNRALWEGRATIGGKISKSHTCVVLTTNLLKKEFGLEFTPEEKKVEEEYLSKV